MSASGKSNFLLIESCMKCGRRADGLFCKLPNSALHRILAAREAKVYPKGALICQEGGMAHGVFVLCTGKAQISATTPEGHTTVVGEAAPGEIIGVSAVLGRTPYKTTVEVMEQCQLNYLAREEFLEMLQNDPDIGSGVVLQILHDCSAAKPELALRTEAGTIGEKLARLLMQWTKHPLHVLKRKRNETPIRVRATVSEIAHLIGGTEEEVDTTLREFQKKKWLRIDGTTWLVGDKIANGN